MNFIKQLMHFTYQQAMSCIFPVAIFLTMAVSKIIEIPYIRRYDFILLISILVQIIMYLTGLETKDELKVITVFHIIGLILEIYKVNMGSWSYPEEALTKIFGVPLYSGFMYASVASYIIQAWRRLNLKLSNWPKTYYSVSLSIAIYLNFFTHHYLYDFRWILTVLLFIVFYKTWVSFQVTDKIYKMPMVLSYFLIAFFIWVAENISTFFDAYKYPNQSNTWELVHLGKLSSWFLLVVISIIIVAHLKNVKEGLSSAKLNTNLS